MPFWDFYRTFCYFEPQKGYGRVCHRYIGKVTKFGLFKIIIFRSNCHFFGRGGGGKRPPPSNKPMDKPPYPFSLQMAYNSFRGLNPEFFGFFSREVDAGVTVFAIMKFGKKCLFQLIYGYFGVPAESAPPFTLHSEAVLY